MAHVRVNISLSKEAEKSLRTLSKKTGLKMSTIVEKAISLFEKEEK